MTEDYKEAACRMFSDAETLTKSKRLGTPDHLYGLVAECALKAILAGLGLISIPMTRDQRRTYKVHVDDLWCEYSAAISGRSGTAISVSATNPFSGWKAEHRYEPNKTFTKARLNKHRQGANEAMQALEGAMTNGVIP